MRLSRPDAMLDTATLLSIDIALQMAFCFAMAAQLAKEPRTKRQRIADRLLEWYPGVAEFVVMFAVVVWAMYALPGQDFGTIGWTTGVAMAALTAALPWAMAKVLPEKDIRVELLFLGNIVAGLMAIVGTVNGKTAYESNSQTDWKAFCGVALMVVAVALAGTAGYMIKQKRKTKQQ